MKLRAALLTGLLLLAVHATPAVAHHEVKPKDELAKIKTWLESYDAALNKKDLDALGKFYHPDVTIFEGGSVNNGWADYRDHHLAPELKELEGLAFSHSNIKPQLIGADGKTAYVTSEYSLKAKTKSGELDVIGLETLILVKGEDGAWKIRHSHTSSRRRPAAK